MLSFQKETANKPQDKEVHTMDKNKLLYFIKDRGYTIEDFCKNIDMGYAAFYGKCRDNRFLLWEIWQIAEFLKLTLDDVNSIFFAKMVS